MTNREKLGQLGEILVASTLGAERSTNKYDSDKDMILPDGTEIEVKTQNRHPNGTFTINLKHQTNFLKCMAVDRLIFVEYDSSDYIHIYECIDRPNYRSFSTQPTEWDPEGRNMIGWPIDRMKLLRWINNAELSTEMRRLSGAKRFKK
jgi:hypothetical protein